MIIGLLWIELNVEHLNLIRLQCEYDLNFIRLKREYEQPELQCEFDCISELEG